MYPKEEITVKNPACPAIIPIEGSLIPNDETRIKENIEQDLIDEFTGNTIVILLDLSSHMIRSATCCSEKTRLSGKDFPQKDGRCSLTMLKGESSRDNEKEIMISVAFPAAGEIKETSGPEINDPTF
jgi:hypothetical protein